MTLVQLKIGESQASCEALKMAFSWGLYPLFCLFMTNKGSWLSPARSFSLPSFQIYICSFCKKVVQRTWVGLFQASVCSGDHSVAISLSSNLELERTSTSATCLHWSYFMSTRKTAFWIQERILFQFLKKKAQLVLLSVYPTYPFTFYVNCTKRHVTWSICPHTLLFNTISVLKLPLLYIYNLLLKINCIGALIRFRVQNRNLMVFCILR